MYFVDAVKPITLAREWEDIFLHRVNFMHGGNPRSRMSLARSSIEDGFATLARVPHWQVLVH